MSEEQKDNQQPTLTDFIEKNHKLITTVGVLATLAVLAGKLPESQFSISGKFLSFLLFVLALIVCLEVFENFPWTEKGKLYWFRVVFTLTVLGFIMVWARTFYPFLLMAFLLVVTCAGSVLVFALCAAGIRKLVLKIPWFKGVSRRTKEQLVPMFGALALMLTGALILRHFKLF